LIGNGVGVLAAIFQNLFFRGENFTVWEREMMDVPLIFAVFFLSGFNIEFILTVLFA